MEAPDRSVDGVPTGVGRPSERQPVSVTRGNGDHVAFFLPLLAGGGAERVMLNIAAGFAGRGFRTDLVLGRAEGPYLKQVPPDVRVVDLNTPRILRSLRRL
jgi:hypothetical protein